MDLTQIKTKRKRLRHNKSFRNRRIRSPEVGSLYDILHDNATKSLYVSPIGWTDLHVQLLGCRFVRQPSQVIPTPTPLSSQPRTSPRPTPDLVVSIGRTLDNLMDPFLAHQTPDKTVQSLLTLLFPGRLCPVSPDLSIRCGRDRFLGSVRCQAVWKKSERLSSFESTTTCSSSRETPIIQAPAHVPVLAFLDLHNLNFTRKGCFRVRPSPDGSMNVPIHRLHEIRTAKLFPKNPDEDQYILAIMLAMAQRHVYTNVYKGFGFMPKDVELRILAVSEQDHSLIVYKSVIPAAFLIMFNDLTKAPQGGAKITIQYQRVPVWPILGLKERLGQALGKDLVGEVDVDRIETFQNSPLSNSQDGNDNLEMDLVATLQKYSRNDASSSQVSRELGSSKRKRHILSEVMNVSFSEDRDSPDLGSLVAKRRHLEEGRVGVVR